MATTFTDDEKTAIRKWMGFADIYHDADPRLENAITAIENLANPAPAIANIAGVLAQLAVVETKLNEISCLATVAVGKISVDPVRARMVVLGHGRMQVNRLAIALRCDPAADAFAASDPTPHSRPFRAARNLGGWP